jgi:GNAT superfamily N-acetyltransferase
MNPLRLDIARSPAHLQGILDLQRRNLRAELDPDEQARSGFVFAEHDADLLERMVERMPQAVALQGDQVVGCCLAVSADMQDLLPSLSPMFREFDRHRFLGRRLSDFRYVVGGQVCVARAWRGQGLIARLYAQTRAYLDADVELCLTEISASNAVSLRAHARIGFIEMGQYRDAGEHWHIVGWPWRAPVPSMAESAQTAGGG